jgi:short chain dehydrogenase
MSGGEGKTAIVTGGSRGLGRNTAIHLARRGVDVLFTYHSNLAEAQNLIREVEAMGRKAAGFQLDAGNISLFDGFVGQVRNMLRVWAGALQPSRHFSLWGGKRRNRSIDALLGEGAWSTRNHSQRGCPGGDRDRLQWRDGARQSRNQQAGCGHDGVGTRWHTGRYWADDCGAAVRRQPLGEWAAYRGLRRDVAVNVYIGA